MNIYAVFPLVAVIAYFPLIITTLMTRPMLKSHKLFMGFLVPAMAWSLADFFWRSDFAFGQTMLLSRITLACLTLMLVNFHYFTSSFFARGESRWLPLAFFSLIMVSTMVALGFIPRGIRIEGGVLYPEYGPWILAMVVPFLALAARNVYVFTRRLRSLDNPVLYNQILSMLAGLSILLVFLLASVLPFGREFPIGHIGNLLTAVLLSYATLRHKLVPVSFVLRRGLAWISLGLFALLSYWGIVMAIQAWSGMKIDVTTALAASGLAMTVAATAYTVRNVFFAGVNRAFQGERFVARKNLSNFANNIHKLFSFKEQGGEFLGLLVKAIGCKNACLLFLEPRSEEYIGLLVQPETTENPMAGIRLNGHNPVVEHLKREYKPLSRTNLEIMPEFRSLWAHEEEAIRKHGIELFMPLISRNKLIGILVLGKKETGRYSLADYNLLEEVTVRVAVSMEKEYLQEQLRERERELSVINRSAAIVTSSLDIQQTYANFVTELKKIVDVNWTAILVKEDSEIRFLTLSSEIGSAWQVGERIPLAGTVVEWLAEKKKSLVESDLTVESRFESGTYFIQQGIRSTVSIPLIAANKVIGALIVASRNAEAYPVYQVKLLEEMTEQIAASVENSLLFNKAEQRARIDGLTNLLNRQSLDEIIINEINRHTRYGGIFSVLLLDMDSLKTVNDNQGHLAGDDVLRSVSRIIKGAIRSADQAFRYGGDEFAVLLPQTTTEEGLIIAERLRKKVNQESTPGGEMISISIGVAGWPANGIDMNDLIFAADAALYQAKRDGKNRSQRFEAGMAPVSNHGVESIDRSEHLSTIYAMAAAVDARDRYTRSHSKKVNEFALAMAEVMHLGPLEKSRLSMCALLHDVGKIGVSSEVLNKSTRLSDEDWKTIRMHPLLSAAIISHVPHLAPCIPGIRHHHERYDGRGYPDGLKGEEIPLEARILCIADSFAAMTSERHYLTAMTHEQAIDELVANSGKQFDPVLVEQFILALKDTSLKIV